MADFDYDKIKNMEYDLDRKRYVADDGSEFRVTPYSNGTGYKYDYYDRSTYGNTKHNSTHVTSDLNENWNRTDNDRDNETQDKSSGSGCYLTTSCMKRMCENFDDNCDELTTLRWFRDHFVNEEDVKHYYDIAPHIVAEIDLLPDSDDIYAWIYDCVIMPSVKAIQREYYEFAYNLYKSSVLSLEDRFIKKVSDSESPYVLKK